MISFSLEKLIKHEQLARLFADFVRTQEVCLVYHKAVDDTNILYSFEHTQIGFAFLQQSFGLFCRSFAFSEVGNIFLETVDCIFEAVRIVVGLSQIQLSTGYPSFYGSLKILDCLFRLAGFQAADTIPIAVVAIGRLRFGIFLKYRFGLFIVAFCE